MNILLEVFQLLPAIMSAVISVEASVTAAGTGATKKQIVMAVIESLVKSGESYDNKLVQAISLLVDNLVSIFNTSSLFGFGKAPVAPVAAA